MRFAKNTKMLTFLCLLQVPARAFVRRAAACAKRKGTHVLHLHNAVDFHRLPTVDDFLSGSLKEREAPHSCGAKIKHHAF